MNQVRPAAAPAYRRSTIPELLAGRVHRTPDAVAFCTLDAHDDWTATTWRQYAARVTRTAAALHAFGLRHGDRAAILAPNSIEWEITQMACMALGVSVVGVDVNYPADLRDTALRAADVEVLFVQDESAASALSIDAMSAVKRVVVFRSDPASTPRIASLEALVANVAAQAGPDALAAVGPDDEALVVFSSGSTGLPKPIPYTHGQVLAAIGAILEAYPEIAEGSRLLCWLPLANLFQRIVDFCGVERGATSYILGDPREVMRYVRRTNPHVLIGVPRFFEKLHAGIRDRVAAAPRPISALTNRALATGTRRAVAAREKRRSSALNRGAARIADRLVLRRIRRVFGSNLRYLVSGSAPMPLWLLDWFAGIGLPVLEAYGVSENIVPVAMNRPSEHRPGTVGKPLSGQEVRLADDNEILVRGPGVFRGYLAERGETAPGPDREGFWATGDYGEFDADGFLRVVGRKSDVFKLSTGRWIAPSGIECALRRIAYIEHAIVLGAGRRFIAALVSLEGTAASSSAARHRDAHRSSRSGGRAIDDVIRQDIRSASAELPPYQRPAGVLILTRPFSIAGGELTTNLKLRRATVEALYAAQIHALFAAMEKRPEQAPAESEVDALGPLIRWA